MLKSFTDRWKVGIAVFLMIWQHVYRLIRLVGREAGPFIEVLVQHDHTYRQDLKEKYKEQYGKVPLAGWLKVCE